MFFAVRTSFLQCPPLIFVRIETYKSRILWGGGEAETTSLTVTSVRSPVLVTGLRASVRCCSKNDSFESVAILAQAIFTQAASCSNLARYSIFCSDSYLRNL